MTKKITALKVHPLDIFQRGRAGKPVIGETHEDFERARSLLWAAPDLLEAARLLVAGLEDRYAGSGVEITGIGAMRAAIAKAEGREVSKW